MNERIKELAIQSGLKQRIWNSLGKELPMWQEDPDNPGLAKFAELIVKECMDLASAEQKRYANITHRDMSECAVALGNFSLLLKDHFEGEE